MNQIDALFLSYFEDLDRWEGPAPYADEVDGPNPIARTAKQSVTIDDDRLDLSRFLSWVRYDSPGEYRRYDSYTPTHLSGSFYRSFLGDRGLDVVHVNTTDRNDLAALAEKWEPRFVLLSTSFQVDLPTILTAMQCIRTSFPRAKVVLGGLALVELERSLGERRFQRLMGAWNADAYVVSALGEEPLLAMLSASDAEFEDLALPNTWLKKDGVLQAPTTTEEGARGLDQSFVRWNELPPESLYHTIHTRTARSCAFKCSFCSFPVNQGALTLADPETLARELDTLKSISKVRSLVFVDDTFNVPPVRFKEILRVLARYDFEWYSFCRCSHLDRETVELMRDSGCRAVFLGLESIDDQVLKNMDKAATRAGLEKGVELLNSVGITMHANFIIGFPGDRPENAPAIAKFVDDHEIPFFTVSPWYYSPGTPITARAAEFGIEGAFWNWKHSTMNSMQAHDLEEELIALPKRGVYVSERSSNGFWSELMLYSNGFSVAETQAAIGAYNELAGKVWSGRDVRARDGFKSVERALFAHDLPEPPSPARDPREWHLARRTR